MNILIFCLFVGVNSVLIDYNLGQNITVYTKERRYNQYATSVVVKGKANIRIASFTPFQVVFTSSHLKIKRDYKFFSGDLYHRLSYNNFMILSDNLTQIDITSASPIGIKIVMINPMRHFRLIPNYFNTTLLQFY